MASPYENLQSEDSHDAIQTNVKYEKSESTPYRSAMSPRTTHLQRTRPTGLNIGNVITRTYHNCSSASTNINFGPGLASLVHMPGIPLRSDSTVNNTVAAHINRNRLRDKRDLEILNDKFAQYLEKVRFLEAHNRKLALELQTLQDRFGQGSSRIKEIYDIEITEAKKLIDDTTRHTIAAQDKAFKAEQELDSQRARYNNLSGLRESDLKEIDAIQRQIAENEAQIALLNRRMNDLDDELRLFKKENQHLLTEIRRLQEEIQHELFFKCSCEVEKLVIEDELANLKQIHEADLAELRSQNVTNDLDPSQFFRNELSQAIREIRKDYETTIDNKRNDLQNNYSLIVSEIMIRNQQFNVNPMNEKHRQEVERLRSHLLLAHNQNSQLRAKNQLIQNEIDDLRRKIKAVQEREARAKDKTEQDTYDARNRLANIEAEYAQVTAFKTSLEKEIATYREYLESSNGLRGCVDRIVQSAEQKSYDQFDNSNYLRPISASSTSTRTTSHEYMNIPNPMYGFRDLRTDPYISNYTSRSSSVPSPNHIYTSTYRMEPYNDVSIRNTGRSQDTSERNSTIYEYILEEDVVPGSSRNDAASSTRGNESYDSSLGDDKQSEEH